ncbi:acetyltransferase [Streptomyces noursei ZPM]|uniref:N-acetyltransferase n=1 Tax=Streptomyces noursei TaxID=1971 RepID=A0A401R9L9_STRNR|nr:GNAT family N-acetyltransferase [Streptomyces noursei]AKA06583.1 acetyltransferase [Streptomyces noursei ZPM]EOS97321.1 acetyltransferase [Streptomyces noursei CCRC 11814]EXU87557.1 acetyltransferase [Streptomyces noursei PD-1]UWS75093.1 GNAT family N-acetyltransferase [Streptomyces noursei]GCB94341.1 N-acetyltransferase [Streptomyces noursei]
MSLRLTALTDPAHGPHGRRLAWLASDADSHPVGTAFLRLFTDPGREHLAELALHVHPVERRRRVGSRLLDAAVATAREHGRRRVISQAEAGSPGDRFLAARGFRTVLTLRYTRLPLADVDTGALDRIVERPHPGYRLASWRGTVPDHLVQTFVASRHAMDDMPMGDPDRATVSWDEDRVRAAAQAVEGRGDHLHTVAAVDTRDGSIAGFTELVVPGSGTGDGQHYGTGVLPEHRGHGLGRWMKAASIRQALADHPDLAGLLTDTAVGNAPMRRINDALGYAPTHLTHQHQREL